MSKPDGLGVGGDALWVALYSEGMAGNHEALLVEACRAKDRLDKLDAILRGDVDTWTRLVSTHDGEYEIRIDDALVKANSTATSLRQLIAVLPEVKDKPKASNALDELNAKRKERGAAPTRKPRTKSN